MPNLKTLGTNQAPSSPLEKYVQEFLEYCEIGKNQSRNTTEAYKRYLKRFTQFALASKIYKPESISLGLIKDYRLFLNRLTDENNKGLKIITQNYHLIALRAFLKYLTKQDIKTLAPEKIELPKNPERQVEFLDKDELQRLFDAAKQAPTLRPGLKKDENDKIVSLRDYAILHTLFSTGLRVSELANLKREGINLERREFTVRGKGGKLRLVFLSEEAAEAIKKYLSKRKDNNKALFLSHPKVGQAIEKEIDSQGFKIRNSKFEIRNSTPGLTPRSIQRILKKYCLLAGVVKHVTPHTLRHSFATDLLQNGADIRSVQTLLGHASITTTQIYTHITNQGLRDIHKKYHNRKN